MDLQPPTVAPLSKALVHGLIAVYSRLDSRLRGLGVSCWVRGRCCDFRSRDYRLYASSVEIAYARMAPGRAVQRDPVLCPFWVDRRCTAHDYRPLGCRTYFCDPRYRDTLESLYEEHYGDIRALAQSFGYSWYYGPFVEGIREAAAAGHE